MKKWIGLAALCAVLPLAAACGGDDDDDDAGNGGGDGGNGAASDGAWKGEYDTGNEASIELFVPASDPALARFEELREAAGAPAVIYGRVTAENSGERPDTGRFVTLTGADGEQFADSAIVMDFACALAYRWSQAPGLSPDVVNTYLELLEDECGGATIAGREFAPGETITFFVAVEGDAEPEFERVFAGAGREFKR